ncbi:hypothetical protein [Microbacterium sp. K24]|uniref:phage terminase small subunit n=1 Tax=Microbacterium sp. K24 TaxID=2305446 RepID=UPI00109D2AE1|nr:hypothetical protein [Microbacterium sp. K24]
MPGKGPAPSERRSRARDTVTRDIIKSDGKLGGFDLPNDVLPLVEKKDEDPDYWEGEAQREEWHPATVRWWQNWRESPQAVKMLTAPDWDYLLDTALLHHQMWMSGGKNSERAAEIRIRVNSFGATVADRLRLRLEVEVPEEYSVGNVKNSNVTSIDDRRKRIGKE